VHFTGVLQHNAGKLPYACVRCRSDEPACVQEGVPVENPEGNNSEAEGSKANLSVSEEDENGDDRSEEIEAKDDALNEGTAGEDGAAILLLSTTKSLGLAAEI
jgi:hypothetical protein